MDIATGHYAARLGIAPPPANDSCHYSTYSPSTTRSRIIAAFNRPADEASILQGVRKLRQGKPNVRIVLVPSPKNDNNIIACEGRLEEAMAKSLELDLSVASYRGQAFFMPGSKGREVVCDFTIRHTDGTYRVVDVKPNGQMRKPSVVERMRHVKTLLSESEIPHRVITNVELTQQPARQIREQLRKGLKTRLTVYQRDLLLAEIQARQMTVGDARRFARSNGLPAFAIEKLAVRGLLSFQINAPWGSDTLIGDFHARTITSNEGWGSVRDVVVQL